MNKEELIEAAAFEAQLTKKDTAAALQAILDAIVTAVAAGDKVLLVGFGSFEARERQARTARNPKTGGVIRVPATTVPAFSPGKAFRDAVSTANN